MYVSSATAGALTATPPLFKQLVGTMKSPNRLLINPTAMDPIPTNTVALLSTTTVSHAGLAQTTLLTVPTGYKFLPDHVDIEAAGDEADTDITLGASGALTDFMGTTQLDNLDAADDIVTVRPIPADPPLKQKVYAAGIVFQVDVTAANGNAGNTYYLYGTLVAV